ncbi:MAG TPA: beta-eliminating lyase-related protein [Steroidobacteraceae bacterium]
MTMRIEFVSDNVSAMAPEALAGIVRANEGFAPAYGADPFTARARKLLCELFDADAEVFFVSTGTVANALSLAAVCRSHQAVLAHEHAHIATDEAGAPGFFGQGLALRLLKGDDGRIAPETLAAALSEPCSLSTQAPGAFSLSNATEYGTVYDETALKALCDIAHAHGLPVHLDGARLCNAAAAGLNLKALRRVGVDIVSVGGAKAGLPATEAIVILDARLGRDFGIRLKQAGQVASKARFAAAAWESMLESGAWLERARHANAMARKLARILPFEVAHPVETNAVFVRMDAHAHDRLRQLGWQAFRWPGGLVRFMCSWATTEALIEELGEALTRIV